MKKILLSFVAIMFAGCAAKMDMNIISPAADSDIIDYKNVAVWNVSLKEPYIDYTDVFEKTLTEVKFNDEAV
ncbi:MAG: hypothetical protein IJD28_05765, partial [Deferribacterales bacterium]|nr:hypothetical protein [Deferribacterales bacterium]